MQHAKRMLNAVTRPLANRLGFMVRETGQALDRLGSRLQGSYAFTERLSRHRRVMPLDDLTPDIGNGVFVAPSASVIGAVTIGAESSIWYGTVLRGDVNAITVGKRTNLQDRVVVHGAKHNLKGLDLSVNIGSNVTVGHGATLHACTVKDNTLIGMGATVMDGAVVNENSIVAAGALVTAGKVVPEGELWGGSPAQCIRKLKDEEITFLQSSADTYAQLAKKHLFETSKTHEQLQADEKSRKEKLERSDDYDSHIGMEQKLAHEQEVADMKRA